LAKGRISKREWATGGVLTADTHELDALIQEHLGLTRRTKGGGEKSTPLSSLPQATGRSLQLAAIQALGDNPDLFAVYGTPFNIPIQNAVAGVAATVVQAYNNTSSGLVMVRMEAQSDEAGGTASWLYASPVKSQCTGALAPFKRYGTPPSLVVVLPAGVAVYCAGTVPGGALGPNPFQVAVMVVPVAAVMKQLLGALTL
jgi:hypothetical protein